MGSARIRVGYYLMGNATGADQVESHIVVTFMMQKAYFTPLLTLLKCGKKVLLLTEVMCATVDALGVN
jgi:hypothetical protein